MNRVVITGMGIISSLGTTEDQFWNNAKEGNSFACTLNELSQRKNRHLVYPVVEESKKYLSQVCTPVHEEGWSPVVDIKGRRRLDDYSWYAIEATQMALKSAGLLDDNVYLPSRSGIYLGTGIGGLGTYVEKLSFFEKEKQKRPSPLSIPMMIANIACGEVAIRYNIKGPSLSLVSACATSTHCIGEAYQALKLGLADMMVAGASEAALISLGVACFSSLTATTTSFTDDPKRASRPFDRDRDGFVMSEGASILILETLENAQKRGAQIYGEIKGYATTTDAHHITAPDPTGEGATNCMKLAVESAGLTRDDIGYINAHGTSTQKNDSTETLAIKNTFGKRAYEIPISSLKSMTGHALAASGGFEVVATLKMLENQFIAPTINYENEDPECDLDYVPNKGRFHEFDYALTNSFGFGGHNACIVLGKV